jgi:preprotein translocase subunit SecD
MSKTVRAFLLILFVTAFATLIALPPSRTYEIPIGDRRFAATLGQPTPSFTLFGRRVSIPVIPLKKGLDIQGGTQVVLAADMSQIQTTDRPAAIESAREIIARRVDLFGLGESVIQTSQLGDQYRILVELPGVTETDEAMRLVGTMAQLDFRLEGETSSEATASAVAFINSFQPTTLTGQQLDRASVQFDQQTNEPVIVLDFNDEGTALFSDITQQNIGRVLAIFIDGYPVALPRIETPILTGQATLTGGFTLDQAKQLSVQLNAGALPVPITVLEQRTIGASLGQESVRKSLEAGFIGVGLVVFFMIAYYGWRGVLSAFSLAIYAVLTLAAYKLLGVTLTLPGIAGLLLSVGMAVDSTILIFERMKEELRVGRPYRQAMELGFGRAWNSIKDANLATIMTALILINPLNLPILNTSGLVRGFGITLLIGIGISLFTGIVVIRTLMRLFLQETNNV